MSTERKSGREKAGIGGLSTARTNGDAERWIHVAKDHTEAGNALLEVLLCATSGILVFRTVPGTQRALESPGERGIASVVNPLVQALTSCSLVSSLVSPLGLPPPALPPPSSHGHQPPLAPLPRHVKYFA